MLSRLTPRLQQLQPLLRFILRAIKGLAARQHRPDTELGQMSQRELNDLGIGRSEIPALLQTSGDWAAGRR